jgi:hypothetical protein
MRRRLCYRVRCPPQPDLMATCPRCKGHLTDSHQCPRRSFFVAAEVIAAALAGGFAGLLLVVIFDPSGRQITDTESAISVLVGAGVAVWINRALRG